MERAPAVRRVAARVLDEILAAGGPAPRWLDPELERFTGRDRALLETLVRGTLRWLRRLDAVLESASGRPLSELDAEILAPLRLGLYQLLFLDRVPDHAVVSEAVGEVRRRTHRGAAGLANAVLRAVARRRDLTAWPVAETDPLRRLAIETSHPDFLVRRWLERFGRERTLRLLEANNRRKALALLAFADRGGREALAERLRREGVETEPSELAPQGLVVRSGRPLATEAFAQGAFYVQDEASQVAACLPLPAPDERILDAAAAPGGKGLALLALEPRCHVVFADSALGRLPRLAANLGRLGLRCPVLAADARRPPCGPGFDRVVLDLPCSGTGTLRRHPELKWRISPEELARLASSARELLAGAAEAVRPGGLLLAITCSLEPEENEDLVADFLAGDPGFHLETPAALPPALARHFEAEGRWRLLPDADHDGFTVHVLRR